MRDKHAMREEMWRRRQAGDTYAAIGRDFLLTGQGVKYRLAKLERAAERQRLREAEQARRAALTEDERQAEDQAEKARQEVWAERMRNVRLKKVDELELSVRSSNRLKNDNITYVGDLVQKTEEELLAAPAFGRRGINEIKEVLAPMGLHLGMETPDWPPENVEELAARYEQMHRR